MILTVNRLKNIIREIEDDSFENMHKICRQLNAEIEQLKTDAGRDGIIGELSLRSKPVTDEPHSQTNEVRDLALLSSMITGYRNEQIRILRESYEQCLRKQSVFYHVRRVLQSLSKEDCTIIVYACRYSGVQARELLESKEKIQTSRWAFQTRVAKLLEVVLEKVNEQIDLIEDYEDTSYEVTTLLQEQDKAETKEEQEKNAL